MSLLRNFLLSWILSLVSLVSGVATSAASELPDLDRLRFADQIMAFQEWEAKKTLPEGGILFVGSSSIRMRPTAVAFPQKVIINRGFGGAEFPDIFYYYIPLRSFCKAGCNCCCSAALQWHVCVRSSKV